jgi:hypothetical protein
MRLPREQPDFFIKITWLDWRKFLPDSRRGAYAALRSASSLLQFASKSSLMPP